MTAAAHVLDAQSRDRALRGMRSGVDVLVVGGGVVGAGITLDAASRGLRTAMVEATDLGAGTSSRSSKLVHGGLRYLEQLDFGLVREALRERALLLRRLAPHLVRPVSFVYPLRHPVWERAYVGAGVLLYDLMGGRRALPGHRHLTRGAVLRTASGLRPDAMVGGIRYFDGQVDDARLTATLARTAASFGAAVATRTRCVGLLRDGERIVGATVHDGEADRAVMVPARHVVSATGVWTEQLQDMTDANDLRVRASKGVHILVPRDRIDSATGLILRTEKSVLFVIPWEGRWIVGTTDTEWTGDVATPVATAADVDYLLRTVNRVLVRPLTVDDVSAVYAGLRPLVDQPGRPTERLSREHVVAQPREGLTMVAGGKLTTYRVMAEDAVDAVVGALGEPQRAGWTHSLPLHGADGFAERWHGRTALARGHDLPVKRIEHLLRRYGSAIDEVLGLVARRPDLAGPVPGAERYLLAEAVHAALFEGALHLDDILVRRLRVNIEAEDRGLAAAAAVVDHVGEAVGWGARRRSTELDAYADAVEAELAAAHAGDDAAAVVALSGWTRTRGVPTPEA